MDLRVAASWFLQCHRERPPVHTQADPPPTLCRDSLMGSPPPGACVPLTNGNCQRSHKPAGSACCWACSCRGRWSGRRAGGVRAREPRVSLRRFALRVTEVALSPEDLRPCGSAGRQPGWVDGKRGPALAQAQPRFTGSLPGTARRPAGWPGDGGRWRLAAVETGELTACGPGPVGDGCAALKRPFGFWLSNI